MRVLHFAPKVCWPLDTGAKLRNYHLARVLSARADVTLLAFTDAGAQPADPEKVAQTVSLRPPAGPQSQTNSLRYTDVYEQVITVERGPGYTPAKILRGALGRTPLPLLNYTTTAMKQSLTRTLNEQQFDVVQVESIHLMGYLPIMRSAPGRPLVVCDWHNIESELMRRYSEREPGFLRRMYARKTAHQLSNLERQATRDFDAHVVVSERDRERLLQLNPSTLISVIQNGVDSAYYADKEIEAAHAAWRNQEGQHDHDGAGADNSRAKANRIVFVGSMDYHANIDAVVAFARELWPALHERRPELAFTIVGRDPTTEVRELAALPGVEVTGTVDDVRPYYREAVTSIVPLRVGGGSRLKILEAMAAGVPVVSTTLGAEGLDVLHGADILIADTNEQFGEAITSVVENETLRRQLSDAGRALISSRYDWAKAGESLFEIYEELLAARTSEKN